MKIYNNENNVYDAVDAVVAHGIAAVDGTKTMAVPYANRIIKCLEPYTDVSPIIGYQNVTNNGYLYYVHDNNRLPMGSIKLKEIIDKIDEDNT